jgi:tetratricopeptide (TPR) repeat protein
MKNHSIISYALLLVINSLLFIIIGCATSNHGKVPITTSSENAREYFLQGRNLFDKIRFPEALQLFEKAVAEDPNFAMGYLYLAAAQPSAKGLFKNLDRAVALADKVSEGERLWIYGVKAGVDGLPMKQRENYQKLVEMYPNDEQTHYLLANHYFVQQEYNLAVEQYKKATELNPDFSAPYNQLGYTYRILENYTESENAFKKYIKLIPDDPNPYDSYAELLMKIGKYDESIETYQKALTVNPDFVTSYIGIASNLNFKGVHQDARKEIQKFYDMAHNDGERRAAHFSMAVSYVDEGNMGKALEELKRQYALAEKISDASAMAGDLVLMGNILLESGKYDEAKAKYEKAVKLVEESDLSKEVKENVDRGYLFNIARVDLMKKDFTSAKAKSENYREKVEAINNPFQIRLSHQLAGMIALEEKEYDKALEELHQADQQNPYNIYRIALAYRGKGDIEKAKELSMKAAEFNVINSLDYAFVRKKAKLLLDSM